MPLAVWPQGRAAQLVNPLTAFSLLTARENGLDLFGRPALARPPGTVLSALKVIDAPRTARPYGGRIRRPHPGGQAFWLIPRALAAA